MVSKTRAAGIPGLKDARERCEAVKDPEDRRRCLDDVLFDTIDTIGTSVKEMDARSAERVELMEQRLANLIDKGFNKVDGRFNKVDARLNEIKKRVGLHEVHIAQIKSWVGTVFERVNAMEPKVNAMERTIDQYFSKKHRPETV
ncbi:MAG: hypothetical protein JW839_14710 [Candidatus Lokiarchaeota archaeon]|nr:hypothetical protein [Candidatus Lokiarchaeota archaeon]